MSNMGIEYSHILIPISLSIICYKINLYYLLCRLTISYPPPPMSYSAKKKQPKEGRASSCFLGCFGFPHTDYGVGDISKDKLSPSLDGVVANKVPKRRKWFSWARKQRSPTKTVPLDTTTATEKRMRSWSKDANNVVKKKNNLKNLTQSLVNHVPSPPRESTPTPRKTDRTRSNSDKHIITGNKKFIEKTISDAIEEASCEENNPPSPNQNANANAAATANAVTNVSFPLIYKGRSLATSPLTTVARNSNETVVGRKVDSVVGMSIILVMLSIMLLWGKVCAILCTSAWFYFVPRFRMKIGSPSKAKKDGSSITDQIDINSQEYKKKVQLEGFLERNNHRNTVVSISK